MGQSGGKLAAGSSHYAGRPARLTLVLFGLVCALGVGLRFYDLGAESLWMDEVTMARVAQNDASRILELAGFGSGRPPFFVLLAHFWMQAFGTSEVALRALPALIGSLSLPVIYALGRLLFQARVGLAAAFLFAISEFQIYHAQNLRYYSLVVLMTLLSYLFFVLALRRRQGRYFAAYAAASVLLFFSHSYGVFVLAAQGLYFLLNWGRFHQLRLPWLLSQAAIGLALAPGVLGSVARASGGTSDVQQWIEEPQLWFPARTLFKFVFPGRHLPEVEALAAGVGLFALGLLAFLLWRGVRPWLGEVRRMGVELRILGATYSSPVLLVVLWLIFPIAFPFFLSYLLGPMYIDRYTIAAAPALYLLLGLAAFATRRWAPELLWLALVAVVVAPGLTEYYVNPVKEQWREAAAQVETQPEGAGAIVFAPAENGALRRAFTWYYDGSLPLCDLPTRPGDEQAIAAALGQCAAGADRFWLILRGDEGRTAAYRRYFLVNQATAPETVQHFAYTDLDLYLFGSQPRRQAQVNQSDSR